MRYIIVPMDADNVASTQYEVWDGKCKMVFVSPILGEAKAVCERLNLVGARLFSSMSPAWNGVIYVVLPGGATFIYLFERTVSASPFGLDWFLKSGLDEITLGEARRLLGGWPKGLATLDELVIGLRSPEGDRTPPRQSG